MGVIGNRTLNLRIPAKTILLTVWAYKPTKIIGEFAQVPMVIVN